MARSLYLHADQRGVLDRRPIERGYFNLLRHVRLETDRRALHSRSEQLTESDLACLV